MSTPDDDIDQTDRVRAEVERLRGGHNADVAIDFLTWAYPQGPWCLSAIEVDRYEIETATFFPHTADQLRTFLATHARWNLYWSVNQPINESAKTIDKTNIAAAHFLHVDINSRAPKELRDGESAISERKRILTLLSAPPAPIPKPTAVIFSGGGYQGLWRLTEPFVIDGDLSKAEELESYNRQLEWSFNADACHNVDRILRLVGSVNYPNAKKRALGRTIERAVLL